MTFKNLHHLSTIAAQFLAMLKEVVMVLTLDLVQIEIFVYLFIPPEIVHMKIGSEEGWTLFQTLRP